jgi:hypothetical protein
MVKFDHIFISPYEFHFLFLFQFFCPKKYVFETFTWVIIHMGPFMVGVPKKEKKT